MRSPPGWRSAWIWPAPARNCPRLRSRTTIPAADHRWLERIADACERFTPIFALDPPDGIILDITGVGASVGRRSRAGRRGRGAVRGSAHPGRAPPPTRMPPPRWPGSRPIPARPRSVSCRSRHCASTTASRPRCAAPALTNVGDLAGRPTAPLAARFGAATVYRARQAARPRIDSRMTPRRHLPALVVERRFAEPIAQHRNRTGCARRIAGRSGRGDGPARPRRAAFCGAAVTAATMQTSRSDGRDRSAQPRRGGCRPLVPRTHRRAQRPDRPRLRLRPDPAGGAGAGAARARTTGAGGRRSSPTRRWRRWSIASRPGSAATAYGGSPRAIRHIPEQAAFSFPAHDARAPRNAGPRPKPASRRSAHSTCSTRPSRSM